MSPKPNPPTAGCLFVLDLSGGRVLSMKTDGSDKQVLAAVRVAAAGGENLFVGAVRLHRKDADSADVENELTVGSGGIWFGTHVRGLRGCRAIPKDRAAHA